MRSWAAIEGDFSDTVGSGKGGCDFEVEVELEVEVGGECEATSGTQIRGTAPFKSSQTPPSWKVFLGCLGVGQLLMGDRLDVGKI